MSHRDNISLYLSLCVLREGPVYSVLAERGPDNVEAIAWPLTAAGHPGLPVVAEFEQALLTGLHEAALLHLARVRLQVTAHASNEYLVTWQIVATRA